MRMLLQKIEPSISEKTDQRKGGRFVGKKRRAPSPYESSCYNESLQKLIVTTESWESTSKKLGGRIFLALTSKAPVHLCKEGRSFLWKDLALWEQYPIHECLCYGNALYKSSCVLNIEQREWYSPMCKTIFPTRPFSVHRPS